MKKYVHGNDAVEKSQGKFKSNLRALHTRFYVQFHNNNPLELYDKFIVAKQNEMQSFDTLLKFSGT